jgi:pimeloyl-ACP methyl ester carboxylesterase
LSDTHFNSRIDKEYIFTDEELMRLKMPVLFIGGVEDVTQSVKDAADRLGKLLPDLHTVIIPDMGHALVNTVERVTLFLI